MEIEDDVRKAVCDALAKGRVMRNLQKEYFKSRSQSALSAAKCAEVEFDKALDDAAYALRTGHAKPKQGELAI